MAGASVTFGRPVYLEAADGEALPVVVTVKRRMSLEKEEKRAKGSHNVYSTSLAILSYE